MLELLNVGVGPHQRLTRRDGSLGGGDRVAVRPGGDSHREAECQWGPGSRPRRLSSPSVRQPLVPHPAFELTKAGQEQLGPTPVGAIVVDGQGREVGRGVNARYADPDAQLPLAGSHLAHAELVAVSGLGSHARYPDHTLYSTLEPCLLCVGAAPPWCAEQADWIIHVQRR
jgi:hypothetical protein